MIARLYVRIPYSFNIPNGEKFSVYEAKYEDYLIRYYPPQRSSDTPQNDFTIQINGIDAIEGNIIWLDFIKESFNRSKQIECDPPSEVIKIVLDDLIYKIRYVTKGFFIRPIDFPNVSWDLTYLNDDGSKLEKDQDNVAGRVSKVFSFSWSTLDKEIWDSIHKLPSTWYTYEWHDLLLDATASLPSIGPSIVLAATSLEVFIGSTLDKLSKTNSFSPEIWEWLNERDWLKKPSIEEQYDFLLKYFTKKSLKENTELWEAFKNLKNARNTFVHDGEARIGTTVVTLEKTKVLIKNATDIINYIKDYLPEELKWPEYKFDFNITVTKQLK